MASAPFVIIPALTAIVANYEQADLIADKVLPRVPVSVESFRYTKYAQADSFTIPETLVGRKSAPNRVEFSGSEVTDSTQDYGLDAPVPKKDTDQFQASRAAGQTNMVDPKMRAAKQMMGLVATAREKRAADLVFNANSYGANNKRVMSGPGQWSAFDTSTPQQDITDALDSMIMRGNKFVSGRRTWSKLSQNTQIVKAILGNGTTAGKVSRQQFADLFELDEVLVGDGWINTAKDGQAPNLVRIWGNHAALLHQNAQADTQMGITFGFTAQFGGRISGEIVDPDMGVRGGVRIRSAEAVKELVVANDLGFFFQNAVA